MRDGFSMIIHRHAKANNKYLKDYDPEQSSSYNIYLDANNLYGCAMSQPLPIGDFEWKTEFEDFNVIEIADDAEIGYILEVDTQESSMTITIIITPLPQRRWRSPQRCYHLITSS